MIPQISKIGLWKNIFGPFACLAADRSSGYPDTSGKFSSWQQDDSTN
jgi:hypothetical protein